MISKSNLTTVTTIRNLRRSCNANAGCLLIIFTAQTLGHLRFKLFYELNTLLGWKLLWREVPSNWPRISFAAHSPFTRVFKQFEAMFVCKQLSNNISLLIPACIQRAGFKAKLLSTLLLQSKSITAVHYVTASLWQFSGFPIPNISLTNILSSHPHQFALTIGVQLNMSYFIHWALVDCKIAQCFGTAGATGGGRNGNAFSKGFLLKQNIPHTFISSLVWWKLNSKSADDEISCWFQWSSHRKVWIRRVFASGHNGTSRN